MKSWIGCLTLIGLASGALAAGDVAAGKAKAMIVTRSRLTVCSASFVTYDC